MGHGNAGKRLVATGGRLLGHGYVVRPERCVNEDLFLQPGFSGELFLIYAKIHPFVKELREKLNDPDAFLNLEKAVTRTKWGRNRLQFMMKRVEMMRQSRRA